MENAIFKMHHSRISTCFDINSFAAVGISDVITVIEVQMYCLLLQKPNFAPVFLGKTQH